LRSESETRRESEDTNFMNHSNKENITEEKSKEREYELKESYIENPLYLKES